jgi:hypothetical protein
VRSSKLMLGDKYSYVLVRVPEMNSPFHLHFYFPRPVDEHSRIERPHE